jgi:hypothetical protein
MALSTFFFDSKVANSIGGIVGILPMIIYLQFITTNNYLIYLFILMPQIPALAIIGKLTMLERLIVPSYPEPEIIKNIFYPSVMNTAVCWILLILGTAIWFAIYLYLDQVVKSEYGISKHPLFCLRNRRGGEAETRI